jgi:hypothetical protein
MSVLSADNERQNTERTEIEQRKNKETRRICSLTYKPKFCSRCGSSIGRRVPLIEYGIILAVAAAVVWAIV